MNSFRSSIILIKYGHLLTTKWIRPYSIANNFLSTNIEISLILLKMIKMMKSHDRKTQQFNVTTRNGLSYFFSRRCKNNNLSSSCRCYLILYFS